MHKRVQASIAFKRQTPGKVKFYAGWMMLDQHGWMMLDQHIGFV